MGKRNKSDFFVATQIELFLLIVFIVLLSAHFLDDKNAILLNENDALKSRIVRMENEIKIYLATIDSLRRELSILKNNDIWARYESERNRADSLQSELSGTGIGNCLENGFFANIHCYPNDTIEIRIVLHQSLAFSEELVFNPNRSVRYSLSDFKPVGEAILSSCIKRDPQCRYSVRIIDTDDLSKADLKRYTKFLSKYFFYQLGW